MLLLPFQQQIVSELVQENGIAVVASGLGLPSILAALIRLHSASGGILFLLNLAEEMRQRLLDEIQAQDAEAELPVEVNNHYTAAERVEFYAKGGTFIITSRILVVDMLNDKVPLHRVAGIIVSNAHRITESCTEAFIVRLYRIKNKSGYVRALSDQPKSMTSGFLKLERIMKSLFVRKLILWPRFHLSVAAAVDEKPPEVVEIRVPLTSNMLGIQNAVIEVMDACLKELRKTNKVDVEDLTVENGLFKSFDEIVRMQLDPIWHTIGRKTKQLVSDLKTLRKLAEYLVRYDPVTFLKYLDTVRASEGVKSVWVFAGPSHRIFELAKRRVFHILRNDAVQGEQDTGNIDKTVHNKRKRDEDDSVATEQPPDAAKQGVELEVIVEEMPKWKLLREVLEEIQEDIQKRTNDAGELNAEPVFLACKDERTAWQLQEIVSAGSRKLMRDEWDKYLLTKAELHGMTMRKQKKSRSKGQGRNGLPEANSTEQNVLLAAAAEAAAVRNADADAEAGKKTRRKGKRKNEPVQDKSRQTKSSGFFSIQQSVAENGETSDGKKPIPPVHYCALEGDQERTLHTLMPSYVIIYDPDMKFVREVEVFKAKHPSRFLRVYFLFYENSTEARKYEASIQRENSAFETLIRQKASMMIPVDQNPEGEPLLEASATSSRKAGGRKAPEKQMQIVVDMREFGSSLPGVLYQQGIRIVPVTLEVGDYILSPDICVERKSIADLYSSFASGRLYHQAETMTRYYRIPVLLIEFSQDKSFSLQSANDVGDDIIPANIVSKMSLLVLHFPRLRIVWSRSLHATAEIFATLKANQEEPSVEKAMRVGVPTEDGLIEGDVRAENYNTVAVEMLRRLPGVTDANYRSVMDGCLSLAELSLMPVDQLAELMGGQRPARMLREFLDAKCPTL